MISYFVYRSDALEIGSYVFEYRRGESARKLCCLYRVGAAGSAKKYKYLGKQSLAMLRFAAADLVEQRRKVFKIVLGKTDNAFVGGKAREH